MKEYDVNMLLGDGGLVRDRISDFLGKDILLRQPVDAEEIKGHMLKADNNLRFVAENIGLGFFDWCMTGCYYACYHAALGLIMTRGYSSKNHIATLCVLIKEFYRKGMEKEDIVALSNFMDYHDLLFYIETKNKREDATYSSRIKYDKAAVDELRLKAVLFVNKVKGMIKI